MTETTPEKLRALRLRAGLTMAEIAKLMGLKGQSSYQRYESADGYKRRKFIPPEIGGAIAVALVGRGSPPITTDEIALLSGFSLGTAAQLKDYTPYFPTPDDIRVSPDSPIRRQEMPLNVPVYGTAVGGTIGDFSLNGELVEYIRRPPSLAQVKDAFAIFYVNDSMYPAFQHGDPLYINPGRHPQIGDYVLIEMHGDRDGSPGAAYVKKLVRRTERVIVVGQFNPPRDDIKFETVKVKRIWRIVPTKELLGI